MTVIERLKLIQSLSGLTQVKLAEKLGLSFVALNSLINGKSKPRRQTEENIDNLYFKYTNQKTIVADSLTAKKQIISDKSRGYKNILTEIIKNPDIYDQFLLSLTYHTNRIEGSTLTEEETRAILFDNIALPNKDMVEQLEAKNHQTALRYLFKYLAVSSPKINEALILKLHSILINSIREDAGVYRNHGVRIVGTNVSTANYLKIPALMKQIIKDINCRNKDIIAHLANIHSRFEQVHPFSDGNGRIGRLIMHTMSLLNNLPPIAIKQEKKRLYNSCLRKSQLKGDFIDLENFICDAVFEGFKILERRAL
ncbi:Fic family protein [Candidatus Parcubacteria bacterium]|nr:Fic family protein [Candidatus Parcubacteria bacterium]